MHTASLYAHTGSHGIDAVIIALHSHLSTLAGDAGHLVYGNQSVLYLGHLSLKHALQESRVGTAQDDAGRTVGVIHA